jgi:prepilin peptidase CpaA
MLATNFTSAVPLLAIVAFATVTDLRSRRIPNGLSLGGAALALVVGTTLYGAAGFWMAVLGWLFSLACFMPFYLGGGMAAGDVKLMAMVGAFLGPIDGLVACACTLMAGAALASLVMVARKLPALSGRRVETAGRAIAPSASARGLEGALGHIPYAAAIAIGAATVVLQPTWLVALVQGAMQ